MIENTAARTAATHDRSIRRPRVAAYKPRTEAPAFDPALVSTTLNGVVARTVLSETARTDRMLGRERPLPMRHLGIDTGLDTLGLGNRWTERALSDCEAGCKVMENDLTGERVVDHAAIYGCKRR